MDWGAVLENTMRGLIGEQFVYFALAAIGLTIPATVTAATA